MPTAKIIRYIQLALNGPSDESTTVFGVVDAFRSPDTDTKEGVTLKIDSETLSDHTLYKIYLSTRSENYAKLQEQVERLDSILSAVTPACGSYPAGVQRACQTWSYLRRFRDAEYISKPPSAASGELPAETPSAAGGESSTGSESTSATAATGQSSAGTVKGLQAMLDGQQQHCPASEADTVDDSVDSELEMLKTIFEHLPECKRMTGFGGGLGDFTAGQKSEGCEQVNVMVKKLKLVNKTVTCLVKTRIQSTQHTSTQTTDVLVKNLKCQGDINITVTNSAEITVINEFTVSDVDDIVDITAATVKDVFDTEQLSKNGFLAQGDGNKSVQMSNTDITNIKKDSQYRQSLNSTLVENFQKTTLKVVDVSGGGDCAVTVENYSKIVADTVMDLIAKRVKETTIATTVDSVFKSKQTNENTGFEGLIEAFFDGLAKFQIGPVIVAVALIAGLIIVAIIFVVALNPGDGDSPFGQMMMHQMRHSGGLPAMHRTRKSVLM